MNTMTNNSQSTDSKLRPAFATIKDWVTISGISRSKTYELLNIGDLKAVRVGGRTLIDVEAGLDWLGQQPQWNGKS
ncbi:MAG: hypothetical protein CBB65_01850 [Hyphomonadaceae bacterium TMED5]|nr:excisionase [Ponticaulis sp.]OUY01206.1 MAG: hypothetical protein CBB65_01850 [Hyphomonadaceae bacterium TMED5]